MSRYSILAALLATGVLLGPAQTPLAAQEKDSPASARADDSGANTGGERPAVLREKTVYVPYGKLEEVFEKQGRGIFLPYEEFLRLWNAAQPKPPEPAPDPPPANAVVRGGNYKGEVNGEVARFSVDYAIDALKDGWSEVTLPLKNLAVESITLSDPAVIFTARNDGYALFLPRKGSYQAQLSFSVRIASVPGKKTISFGIPPVGVSSLELTIPEEDVRVDVQPLMAAKHTETVGKTTRLHAFVGNAATVTVSWMPPPGKATEGAPVLFVEQSARASLGERVLRLSAELDYQVIRGEVGAFQVRVPDAMNILRVDGKNISKWLQSDDLLTVDLHSPVKSAYKLALVFERTLDETPEQISVPLPRVEQVNRESGWLVLSHDSALKVRVASSTGLSQLDPEEVPKSLRKDLRIGFRYLSPPQPLDLEVEKIVPQVRSEVVSVVTLGHDQDRWVGFVDYQISKAGIFRLEFRVPERWQVEEVGTVETVEDYETAVADGVRSVVVNLKSRQLGQFRLPFRLTTAQGSTKPVADDAGRTLSLTLSPPHVAGTEQDRGVFGINAPRSVELTPTTEMRSVDDQELFRTGIMGQVSTEGGKLHAYSYREHSPDSPAVVELAVASKRQEINVTAQHLIEISDGQIKLTHYLDYEILYREVQSLSFVAPSRLDSELQVESADKKFTPEPVPQESPAGTEPLSLWTVTLESPTLRPITLTISYEIELKDLEPEQSRTFAIPLLHPQRDRIHREEGFVAIRREGSLEIQTTPAADGLQSEDASNLPDKLRGRGQIFQALRYYKPTPKIDVTLTRFKYEPLVTTAVRLLSMTSELSEDPCKLITHARLDVRNTSRAHLELQFPAGSKPDEVKINGRAEDSVKPKDDAYLIPLPPSGGEAHPVVIDLRYEQQLGARMRALDGVGFETLEVLDGVPVQKIELDLYLPREFTYLGFSGNFRRRSSTRQALAAGSGTLMQGRKLESFETLAPVGQLNMVFASPKVYDFLKFVCFVATIALGYLLVFRQRYSRLWVIVGLIAVPWALYWFSGENWDNLFEWSLAGSIGFCLVVVALVGLERYRDWRRAHLAVAPDPFIEDAQAAMPAVVADETAKKPDAPPVSEDSPAPKKRKSGPRKMKKPAPDKSAKDDGKRRDGEEK